MSMRPGDLESLIDPIFEIDAFRSKMGEDRDIVVLSFSVQGKNPAEDLVSFVEKGYKFVLDADLAAVNHGDGDHRVYVELDRDKEITDHIMNVMDGIGKLSNINNFKFRYHKNFKSHDLNAENINRLVPKTPEDYSLLVNESTINNFKTFFDKSALETINLKGDILTIKKAYADPINFEVVNFGPYAEIQTALTERINVNEYGEIIFLTKYLGNYNITKYGGEIVVENHDHLLVLKRL
jgi:hypothetical protein